MTFRGFRTITNRTFRAPTNRPWGQDRDLDADVDFDTMCHMRTISIRELHEKTRRCVREAIEWGPVVVIDRGRPVATIVAYSDAQARVSFATRKLVRGFAGLPAISGDCTESISSDRDRR